MAAITVPDHLIDVEIELSAGNQDFRSDDARHKGHGKLAFDASAAVHAGNVRAELRLQHAALLLGSISQSVQIVNLSSGKIVGGGNGVEALAVHLPLPIIVTEPDLLSAVDCCNFKILLHRGRHSHVSLADSNLYNPANPGFFDSPIVYFTFQDPEAAVTWSQKWGWNGTAVGSKSLRNTETDQSRLLPIGR